MLVLAYVKDIIISTGWTKKCTFFIAIIMKTG